jgi:hypothetical protein
MHITKVEIESVFKTHIKFLIVSGPRKDIVDIITNRIARMAVVNIIPTSSTIMDSEIRTVN